MQRIIIRLVVAIFAFTCTQSCLSSFEVDRVPPRQYKSLSYRIISIRPTSYGLNMLYYLKNDFESEKPEERKLISELVYCLLENLGNMELKTYPQLKGKSNVEDFSKFSVLFYHKNFTKYEYIDVPDYLIFQFVKGNDGEYHQEEGSFVEMETFLAKQGDEERSWKERSFRLTPIPADSLDCEGVVSFETIGERLRGKK